MKPQMDADEEGLYQKDPGAIQRRAVSPSPPATAELRPSDGRWQLRSRTATAQRQGSTQPEHGGDGDTALRVSTAGSFWYSPFFICVHLRFQVSSRFRSFALSRSQ